VIMWNTQISTARRLNSLFSTRNTCIHMERNVRPFPSHSVLICINLCQYVSICVKLYPQRYIVLANIASDLYSSVLVCNHMDSYLYPHTILCTYLYLTALTCVRLHSSTSIYLHLRSSALVCHFLYWRGNVCVRLLLSVPA